MIPLITFTYLMIEQLPAIDEVLSSNRSGVREFSQRYALICLEDNQNQHLCPMFEYLYDDIVKADGRWYRYYEKLVKKYGEELVDLLILKDDELVRKKIKDIIDFAFDQLYKTDRIQIEIGAKGDRLRDDNGISMRILLIATLQLYYDVIESDMTTHPYKFIIRKGEER